MKVVKIIGIAILLTNSPNLFAQQTDYLDKMESLYDVPASNPNYSRYISESGNPVEFVFATLFVGYKVLLSSQDMGSCVFHPSCSVYGIQSIRHKGAILGTIATFDRLTRCHPFAGGKYPFDRKTKKLYDPVN